MLREKKIIDLTIRVALVSSRVSFSFSFFAPAPSVSFSVNVSNVPRGCTNSSKNDRQIPAKLNCSLVTGHVVTKQCHVEWCFCGHCPRGGTSNSHYFSPSCLERQRTQDVKGVAITRTRHVVVKRFADGSDYKTTCSECVVFVQSQVTGKKT